MDPIISIAKDAARSIVKYPIILVPDILFYLLIAGANALLLGSTGINSFLTSITKLEPLQAQQQVKEFLSANTASFTLATSGFLLLYILLGVLAISMILAMAYRISQKKKPIIQDAFINAKKIFGSILSLRILMFIILIFSLWVFTFLFNALGKSPAVLIFLMLLFIAIVVVAAHLWFRLFFIYPRLVIANNGLWQIIKETYTEGKSTMRMAVKGTFCIAVVGVVISILLQAVNSLFPQAASVSIVTDSVLKILLFSWSQLFTFFLYFSLKKDKAPRRA